MIDKLRKHLENLNKQNNELIDMKFQNLHGETIMFDYDPMDLKLFYCTIIDLADENVIKNSDGTDKLFCCYKIPENNGASSKALLYEIDYDGEKIRDENNKAMRRRISVTQIKQLDKNDYRNLIVSKPVNVNGFDQDEFLADDVSYPVTEEWEDLPKLVSQPQVDNSASQKRERFGGKFDLSPSTVEFLKSDEKTEQETVEQKTSVVQSFEPEPQTNQGLLSERSDILESVLQKLSSHDAVALPLDVVMTYLRRSMDENTNTEERKVYAQLVIENLLVRF